MLRCRFVIHCIISSAILLSNSWPTDAQQTTVLGPISADSLTEVVIVPDVAPGFLDATCYMEDEGHIPWAEPFENYRLATAPEVATYRAHHPALFGD